MNCPKCGKQFKGAIGAHVWKCDVTPEELFWARVDKSAGESACWPWTLAKHRDGYGRANVRKNGVNRIRIAHRIAWEFANGPVPADKDVCHTCDNRICCNPAHLWLGTEKENMADCKAKGRYYRGPRIKGRFLPKAAT